MKDLSNDIIASIEKRSVTPVSQRWYRVRKIVLWCFVIASVAAAALALALIVYLLQSIDWHVYAVLGYGSVFLFIMSAFPYIFAALLIGAFFAAYSLYRKTPKGHRVNVLIIIILLVVFGSSAALLLHMFGVNQEAHFRLAHMPLYHHMVFTKEREWLQPQKGLLWGEVMTIAPNEFVLRDVGNVYWYILHDEKTVFDDTIDNMYGKNVKIIGEKKGDTTFYATEVSQWDGVMNCNGQRNENMHMRGNSGMMRGMMRGMMDAE